MSRLLIVNADDFGLSAGINQGIIETYERGIVTSTSLMVRGASAEAAAVYGKKNPRLSVGLHLDLAEYIYRDGVWSPLYLVVDLADPAAIEREVRSQLATFVHLMGRPPTHLDSHQHVHRDEPLRSISQQLASEIGVPLRHFTSAIQYCGNFYGQDEQGNSYPELISAESLIGLLERLPDGVTELACHPGQGELKNTMYVSERRTEVLALCDARVRVAIQKCCIELVSFHNYSKLPQGRLT